MPTNDDTAPTSPMFGAAARAYRTAGWPSVLPLPHARKTPPPEGFTGRDGAWPDDHQIDQWAERFPDGNLALRLPPDVIGIDVDSYGDKPGAATLNLLEAELGPLPPTRLSTSRADGTSGIRLYRTPQRPSWSDPGPGIEIIHAGWRYVIAAPSIHDQTGQPYRWIDQTTGEIVTGAPTPASLPELPTAWAERLSSDRDQTKADVEHGEVDRWIDQLADGNPCKATRGALDAFHTDLRAGGARHDAMLDATGRLARALERGHRGGPAALTEAHHAFVTAVTGDGTRNPQQAEQEWRRALEGAYALVAATPTPSHDRGCRCSDGDMPVMPVTTLDPPTPHDGPQDAADEPPGSTPLEQLRADPEYRQLVAQEATRLVARDDARLLVAAQQLDQEPPPPLVALADFLAQPDPEVSFRIEDLWPAGGRVLLAAQYKAGKTTAVGNLLRALADGQPFLDRYQVHQPERGIVLIDDELHENTLRRWLRDQTIDTPDRIHLVPLRGRLSTFDILDPTVRTAWADRLRQVDAQVVVLDCLRPIIDALGLSEDKDVGKVLTAFDELLEEAGADEAVIVHHMGHHGERSRGDSRLRDWPDAEWKIVRQTPDDDDGTEDLTAKRFFSALGRDVLVEECELALEPETRRLTIAGGSRRESKLRTVVDAVVKAVTDEPGLNKRGVRRVVREGIGGVRDVDVDRAVDQAFREHLIRVEQGPNRQQLHYPAVSTIPGASGVSERVRTHGHTGSDGCVRVSLEDTDTHRPHEDPPEPPNDPDTPATVPCTVCGEPTRDTTRAIHARCRGAQP